MNRVTEFFNNHSSEILNIYFTAGHPTLNSIEDIIIHLEKSGVNLVEIGIPYSDPLADGPTIQASSTKALQNGLTLDLLFDRLTRIRPKVSIPFILMGYFNPILQYGDDRFFKACKDAGVDGLIIPDLPLHEYEEVYQSKMQEYDLAISFLITPQTPIKRIKKIDDLTTGFIYIVSSSSITGAKSSIADAQIEYFQKIKSLNLTSPSLIGFGISNSKTFHTACHYANGAIVGSAFIKAIDQNSDNLANAIPAFVNTIRNQ